MRAVIAAVAVLALATPAAARVLPSFDQAAIVKIDHKGKHRGKGHGKKHRRHYDDDRAYHRGYRDGRREARYRDYHRGYRPGYSHGYEHGYRSWSRGQVLPYEYRRYPVYNYDDYGWAPPPRGHAYYRTSTGDIILAAVATGIIVSILTR